jgi:hypothetical protein
LPPFPDAPLAGDLDQSTARPDGCLGTSGVQTPPWLVDAGLRFAAQQGWSLGVDRLHGGAIVPLPHFGSDARVLSVMIGISRRRYMAIAGATAVKTNEPPPPPTLEPWSADAAPTTVASDLPHSGPTSARLQRSQHDGETIARFHRFATRRRTVFREARRHAILNPLAADLLAAYARAAPPPRSPDRTPPLRQPPRASKRALPMHRRRS